MPGENMYPLVQSRDSFDGPAWEYGMESLTTIGLSRAGELWLYS